MMINSTKPAKWQAADLFDRGYSLFRCGKFRDAADYFRVLTLLHATEGNYWIALGHMLKLCGEVDEAIQIYKAALHLGHDSNPDLLLALAECFKDKGLTDFALITLREAKLHAEPAMNCRLELIEKAWLN